MIKMKKELIQRTVKAVRAIRMIILKNNHKSKVNRKVGFLQEEKLKFLNLKIKRKLKN